MMLKAVDGPSVSSPQPNWLKRLAHDLRDPITPLRFAVQQLQSGRAQGEDAQSLLKLMDRQIDAMLQIADEVGDLLRIDRGETLVHLAPAGLSDIMAAAARAVARIAIPETHPVAVLCNPAEMVVVLADDARLAQLITHLLRLLGAGTLPDCQPQVECCVRGEQILVHIRDRARRIPSSARLEFLLSGNLPDDSRSVLMGNLIARTLLEQHQARMLAVDPAADGIAALALELKRGQLPTFLAVEM